MQIRKLPWWRKDKRRKRGEVISLFEAGRARAARASAVAFDPVAADVAAARHEMQLAELRATAARVPRPRFAFDPADVAAIHRSKRHEGAGIWFRLKDGRVIRDTGEPDTRDAEDYDHDAD